MIDFDYDKLAHTSLKLFVETAGKAISHTQYDLILAGGDSGNIMAWITNALYEQMGIIAPSTLVLPVYRHADYAETVLFDNKTLSSKVLLPDITPEKILVVDDEAGTGNTLKGLLDALSEVVSKRPTVTFIAEDDNFDVSRIVGWNIDFIPPQLKVKDVYNAISYIVPLYEYETPVKKVLRPILEELNDKHVMATLLSLPIKEWNNGHPEFTFKFRDECLKQIKDFEIMQKSFEDFIRENIKKAL